MTTEYEFIRMIPVSAWKGKTGRWDVLNKKSGDVLGTIGWYGAWRQYVFFPGQAIFSVGCMQDICSFVEEAKAEYAGRTL